MTADLAMPVSFLMDCLSFLLSWASSFDDAAAVMMEDYDEPAIEIPQLDGSKDIPGRKQRSSGRDGRS